LTNFFNNGNIKNFIFIALTALLKAVHTNQGMPAHIIVHFEPLPG